MYHALVVDDEELQCRMLQQILFQYPVSISVDTALDMNTALRLCSEIKYDFFILDIKMGKMDFLNEGGLKLARQIMTIPAYLYTPILFITSIPEKIEEALSTAWCFQYILKPYSAERVYACLDRLFHSPLIAAPQFSFHNYYGGEIKVLETSIQYISAGGNHCLKIAIQEAGEFQTVDYTIQQLALQLKYPFFRCHRRYIVNVAHIASYDRSRRQLEMAGGAAVPLGRNYKDAFEQIWKLHEAV